MSIAMLLKIFSDCCICFAILGSGPVTFSLPLLIPALLCGASAGIAAFFDGRGLDLPRRLCCVLPFGCLFLAQGIGQAVILAVPAAYTAFVILRGRLTLEYSGYRHFFIRSLVLLGAVYAIANIWAFLTQITNEATLQLDTAVILRYSLVHLLCGIVLQRQLRLGYGSRSNRRQMTAMLGTAATIIAGFLAAEPLLRQGIGTLLKHAVSLLLIPFALLVDGILWLFTELGNDENVRKDYEDFAEYIESIGLGGSQQAGQTAPPDTTASFDPTVLWAVLAGLLLLAAVLLLIRSFHKAGADADPGEVATRLRAAPKKKKAPAFSNRSKVRQLYRDFLRAQRTQGLKLMPNHTSLDVLERIHPQTDRSSAGELRQVYLRARYDDRQSISRSQVEQARRALKGTHQTRP